MDILLFVTVIAIATAIIALALGPLFWVFRKIEKQLDRWMQYWDNK